MSTPCISAQQLRQWIDDGNEFAIVDPREEGDYSRQPHILQAINVPLSHLELRLATLFPRRHVRIAVAGDGGELDARAAQRLHDLGFDHTCLLTGGPAGWQQLGATLFTGFNTFSKAFGEFIESRCHTPSISAQELTSWKQRGKPLVILDSRSPTEHSRATIPGSISTPGAELVLRHAAVAPTAQTAIVVNCAGRTRSIIGAQSLINAGVPHQVVALRNGTMGWSLDGFELELGSQDAAPLPDAQAIEQARLKASALTRRLGIASLEWNAVCHLLEPDSLHTTYLFDVRTADEYHLGHPKGAVHAPGGQLVQATDTWVGVHRAHIVLYDPLGVRDAMTASWLWQMGYRCVYTLQADSIPPLAMRSGPEASPPIVMPLGDTAQIEPQALWECRQEVVVIDVGPHRDFCTARIPDAQWCTRASLLDALRHFPDSAQVVLVSPDGTLAQLAYGDLPPHWQARCRVLQGGMAGWRAASLGTQRGEGHCLRTPNDAFIKPFEAADREKSMKAYLDWEVGLLTSVLQQPGVDFRLNP